MSTSMSANANTNPSASLPPALFEARAVGKRFGGLVAVQGVSLCIPRGQVHGLIGPNGAGKTTFFNLITGLYTPDAGQFYFNGQPYQPRAAHQVVQQGMARTFQNIRLFASMSALGNVLVGQHSRLHSGVLASLLRNKAWQREEEQARQTAQHWLNYVGIGDLAQQPATALCYGDQRRLEIARALASQPQLLLLDEPAAGMNQTEKQALRALLQRIAADGTTLLLIEHDVALVMGLCHTVTVLDYGQVIAQGSPSAVQNDPAVVAAYLGTAHHA